MLLVRVQTLQPPLRGEYLLSDFTLITHHFPAREDIRIYAISDVHFGAEEHKRKEWEQFCRRIADEPNSRVVLGGDLVNNGVKNSLTNCYTETHRPREQKRIITEMLEPLAPKIICVTGGNHESRNRREVDNDITYDICCKLNIEDLYRENICFVKIQMGEKGRQRNGSQNPTYVLAVTHGSGGGMLGSVANRNERFALCLDGIDALIVGHSHRPYTSQSAKIKVDPHNNNVLLRQFKVISMTSWMDWGGYAAAKMLTPTGFAPQTMTLCGTHKEIRVEM